MPRHRSPLGRSATPVEGQQTDSDVVGQAVERCLYGDNQASLGKSSH